MKLWLTGRAKVPLKQLPKIAELIGVDLADLIPLWIEQEAPDDLRETLRTAVESCSPSWEMSLIHFARELHADGPQDWHDATWLDPSR